MAATAGYRGAMLRRSPVLVAAAFALFVPACAGGNLASEIASRPAYSPEGQTKSSVEKSVARPLIVEWPSADRAALEAETKAGIVLVRYDGATIELLTDCRAAGRYVYTATTPSEERETVRDADDLHAKLPLGASGLMAVLARTGSLDVTMTIVGRYKAEPAGVRGAELTGAGCARATHAIMALSTGAFEMLAGARADVGAGVHVETAGAGAKSTSQRELLHKGGDRAVCAKATAEDKAPPYGCGALVRIEVSPVDRSGASGPVAKGDAKPEGSAGGDVAPAGTGATAVPTAAAVAGASPADGPHLGTLPPGTIEGVLGKDASRIKACYVNGLGADPNLRGKVVIRLVIGEDGAVTSATDGGSDLPDKDVIGCIAAAIKKARFPKPEGGSVKAVYPILFSPQG